MGACCRGQQGPSHAVSGADRDFSTSPFLFCFAPLDKLLPIISLLLASISGRRGGEPMKFWSIAACLVASLVSLSPARAAVVISGDNGGRIDRYLNKFELVRASGQQVVIDGPCLSACTLVLRAVPKDRICVTRRASLGCHAC